ncbi:hypothetical protein BG006_008904 [Podila minutissima]|uniref:Uncharacterized protein n=1 Tax=Podila minutissima TaxID=64525 RepID=A0A9P5SFC1_9FUNG|nr:hypothetical protein BG006_008904 [Podila minutissima]
MTAQKQLETSASSSLDAALTTTHTATASSTTQEQQKLNHAWTPGQELAAKLVFGGMGCMIAVVFTNPVDVIKVRLQLQGEAVSSPTPSPHPSSISRLHTTPALIPPSGSHLSSAASTVISNTIQHRDTALLAHSTLDASARKVAPPRTLRLIPLLRDILRNEGPRVFVAGLAPAILREGVYSTIRFGSYDLFKGIYSGMGSAGMRGGEETTTFVKLMSGLTSGMLGSTIANPTDLIKADACRSIYVEEGIPGLYRGVVPTAARAMVVTASQLASYDTTKHWLLKLKDSKGELQFREGYLVHFVASTVAGLVCSISTSPIDTVKVRYMNQQFNAQGKGALYSSAIDCAVKTVSREGPMALYKGFLMCWLRLGPHTMLSLMIFEKLRSFVGINPPSKPTDDVLMKEILAMGGSAQDLELLNDIDSGSEIEGEEDTPSKPKSTKKTKASPSRDVEEPGLKNEVASFMKSLFGNALMDPKKMNEEAEEDDGDDGDDDMEELEDGGESDQDVGSEGSWETEEDVNSEDDSGHDSMDDLPEELKVIAAQLGDRKRKSSPVPDAPAKKTKTDSKKNTSTPSKTSIVKTEPRSTEKNLKAKKLVDVKKQVSAMLGKPSAKTAAPAPVKKGSKSASSKDIKGAKAKTAATKSLASSSTGPGWKLGDGWSKGFEDSEDDISSSKKTTGKNGPSPGQKAWSQRGKGRGVTKSKK